MLEDGVRGFRYCLLCMRRILNVFTILRMDYTLSVTSTITDIIVFYLYFLSVHCNV